MATTQSVCSLGGGGKAVNDTFSNIIAKQTKSRIRCANRHGVSEDVKKNINSAQSKLASSSRIYYAVNMFYISVLGLYIIAYNYEKPASMLLFRRWGFFLRFLWSCPRMFCTGVVCFIVMTTALHSKMSACYHDKVRFYFAKGETKSPCQNV